MQEVFDLKRSLETVKTIINFFRNKDAVKVSGTQSMCGSVKTYPYVLEAIDRIIDKTWSIKDNASPRLKGDTGQNLSGKVYRYLKD